MTLFTRILALLLVLGVVFAAPVSMAASLVGHAGEQSHECVDGCHGAADEHSGGGHDCPCVCHAQVPVAIVVALIPVSSPKVVLVDWLRVGDPLPVEGLPPGVEHPPQNA